MGFTDSSKLLPVIMRGFLGDKVSIYNKKSIKSEIFIITGYFIVGNVKLIVLTSLHAEGKQQKFSILANYSMIPNVFWT